MKAIYKYALKDSKEVVLVEIETEGGQMVKASRARETAKPAVGTMDDAIVKLQPIVPALSTALKSYAAGTKNAEITFGIRLTPDGDALVTSGQHDANFIVTVRQG